MNPFAIAQLVLSSLPTIIKLIETIEAALPAKGQGQQKLDLAHNILQSVYTTGTPLADSFHVAWPMFQGVINSVVGFFNSTGKFASSPAASAPAPIPPGATPAVAAMASVGVVPAGPVFANPEHGA